jgi:hypothetical protein
VTKRKGWRKGKTSEGMMRLADTYRNERLDLTIQCDGLRGWFFYSDGMNSLCFTPPRTFADPIEAMKAAEAAKGNA